MKWNLETRKISEIYPNVKNPRNMGKRQTTELEVSIKKFGLCQPIVLHAEGTILGGHQRVRAVPNSPLTQEEEEELSIRLNKNIGNWDFDLLTNHWEPERLLEWGFCMKELHLESLPDPTEAPKKFSLTIMCLDKQQFELIEQDVDDLVKDFERVRYKVKVK